MPLAQARHERGGILDEHADNVRASPPTARACAVFQAVRAQLFQAERGQLAHPVLDGLQPDREQEFGALAQHAQAEEIGVAALEAMRAAHVIELAEVCALALSGNPPASAGLTTRLTWSSSLHDSRRPGAGQPKQALWAPIATKSALSEKAGARDAGPLHTIDDQRMPRLRQASPSSGR